MTTTTTGVRAWRGTRLGWLGLLPVAGVLLAAVAAAPASAAQLSHPAAPARQAGHHRPAAGVPMTLALAPAGRRAAVRATLARPATAPAASASQTSLLPGDGQADFFGVSIAISGNTALVGGTTAHHHTGAAYVFVHGARGWTQQARLVAADGVALDNFGFSVALDGNTAVVGAPNRGPDGVRSFHGNGGAYVFTRTGTTWTQQALLTRTTDSSSSDFFGFSVGLSGPTALIGIPGDSLSRGAVFESPAPPPPGPSGPSSPAPPARKATSSAGPSPSPGTPRSSAPPPRPTPRAPPTSSHRPRPVSSSRPTSPSRTRRPATCSAARWPSRETPR